MKKELVAAMWPANVHGNVLGDGSQHYQIYDNIVSGDVQLRFDEDGECLSDEAKFARHLRLYVWHDTADNILSISLRIGDIFSAEEHDLAVMLKLLRRLNAKLKRGYPDAGGFVRGSTVRRELQLVLKALGVKQVKCYRSGHEDEFKPIAEFLDAAELEFQRRAQRAAA